MYLSGCELILEEVNFIFYFVQRNFFYHAQLLCVGINSELLEWMAGEATRLNISENGRKGGLIFDEISIQVCNEYKFTNIQKYQI